MLYRKCTYFFIVGWLIIHVEILGQTVVGMGTDSPNPNAVLDLVSPNQNQGFLVPRLTSVQRKAAGFTDKLTSQDHGLMVFDTDEGNIYYWYDGTWRTGSNDNQIAKGTVWYMGDNIPDHSQGEDRDFYIHQPTGDLYRKQEGAFIIVGNLKKEKGQHTAGTGISINDQNEIVNTGDLDSTNELQDLSLSGTVLGLSGSGATVDLRELQDGTGTDNQHLSGSKIGENVAIAIDGGNSVAFSVADGDNDPVNEKITSASLVTGDILRIQEAGADHDVDLSGFQKKTLSTGQMLVGNASGVAAPVTISGDITLDSDGTMTIKLDAITTAKIINEAITTAKLADASVTKDKINADVAGSGLAQNADGSLEVKVAGGGMQIATDQLQLMNQGNGELLIGDGAQVNSQTVTGDISLASTGAAIVAGLQGRSIGSVAPTGNDVLTWNGTAWVPQAPSTGNGTWYSGNVTPDPATPSGAVDGTYYFHTVSQTAYRKESGTWVELGKFAKQSNSTVKGVTVTSTRTPTIYIGMGNPVDDTNNNAEAGDFYFNTSETPNGRLWMKKNNREWVTF